MNIGKKKTPLFHRLFPYNDLKSLLLAFGFKKKHEYWQKNESKSLVLALGFKKKKYEYLQKKKNSAS